MPQALVSIQIALCLATLVAAGLLGRSLANLKLLDIGFERANLAYATVNPTQAGYQRDRIASYSERLRHTLAAVPGVLQVSTTQVRPLSGNGNQFRAFIPGHSYRVEKGVVNTSQAVNENMVGAGLFETLGIPLLGGRTFRPADFQPHADVAIVDELFAHNFFPGENPLGRRFGFSKEQASQYQIVGVVRPSSYNTLRGALRSTVYLPLTPDNMKGQIHFAIRAAMDSGLLVASVRKAVASVDPNVPLIEFHTQTGLIDRILRTERLLGFLSGALSAVALTLAAIGLGGLLAYAVARRTNEIGVRMALGAAPRDVIIMILRDSIRMVAAGIVLGLPGCWAIAKLLQTTLFGLQPLDPKTGVFALLALAAVALLAGSIPANRAARIDPMNALREE
jgi:predicted permease